MGEEIPSKSKIAKWVVLGLLAITALGVFISYLGVIGSVATAPARVINKTLETNNILHNYELFYDLNQNFEATLPRIQQAKQFYGTEGDAEEKTRLRMEMAAIQQSCRDLSAQYNSHSKKLNRSLFKSNDLPYVLSIASCDN